MAHDCAYLHQLGPTGRMRVEFQGWHGRIETFVVQLELWDGQRWLQAVRYDTSHGGPHRDTINRQGREIAKDWLPGHLTTNEAMTFAIDDIRANWRAYERQYWGR